MIRDLVHSCFEEFVGEGRTDLVTSLADPVPPMVRARYLGRREDRADEMRFLMTNYLSSAQVGLDEKAATARTFEDFVQQEIDRRLANSGHDTLSKIVRAFVDDHGLSPVETLGMVRLIISAGHETTVYGIGSLCYRILAAPGARDRLWSEPTLRRSAVIETLRLHPPVMHMARTVVDEHTIRGQGLHQGDKVMVCFGAANRDGERFSRPDEFDLDREAVADVTFGSGRHRCLGWPSPSSARCSTSCLSAYPTSGSRTGP